MKTQILRLILMLFLALVMPLGVLGQALIRLKVNNNGPEFAGNTGYFKDYDGFSITDGTISGTTVLEKGVSSTRFFGNRSGQTVSGKIFYYIGNNGTALYKTDGTVSGTSSVNTSIRPPGDSPLGVVYKDNFYFFSNNDKLIKSDGTAAGTVEVSIKQFRPTSSGNVVIVNDKLYFNNYISSSTKGLWVTDGTELGTTLVRGVDTDATLSIIAILGKKILFTISKNSSSIYTYFVSDGTPAGTVELASSSPLARDISISRQIGVGTKDGILYFSDGANLWRTDFTDQGTYSLTKLGTATYSEYLLTEDGFFFVDVSTTKPSIVKIIGEQKTTAFGGTEVIVKKLVGYNKGVLYYTTAEDNTAGSSRIRRIDNTTVGTYNLINNTDGVENGNVTDQTSNFVVLIEP